MVVHPEGSPTHAHLPGLRALPLPPRATRRHNPAPFVFVVDLQVPGPQVLHVVMAFSVPYNPQQWGPPPPLTTMGAAAADWAQSSGCVRGGNEPSGGWTSFKRALYRWGGRLMGGGPAHRVNRLRSVSCPMHTSAAATVAAPHMPCLLRSRICSHNDCGAVPGF